jgi:hypothetical protein
MQRVLKGDTRVTSAGTVKKRLWRPVAVATTAMMLGGIGAAFATAASAASDPPAPPAANVAPGAYNIGSTRYIVYTGTDGAAWQKQVGTTSGNATSLGGRLISAPSPIRIGGNTTFTSTRIVFGEGTDNALWFKVGNGGWTSLGGRLTSKPGAAVSGAPGTASTSSYRVYVRGADGAVWARTHTGTNPATGWGNWRSVGGHVLAGTGPSAAVTGSGTFNVLVVGTNRALWIANDGGAFVSAGGVTTSSPALVWAPSSSSLVGFARGTTNAGYFHRFLSTTPGWHSMGGVLSSGLGGTSTSSQWFAYGLGTNGQVYEHAGNTNATGGWIQRTP